MDEANYLVTQAPIFGVPTTQAQTALNDAADGGSALLDAQRTAIEQSPYFSTFQYFNKQGESKKVNPKTGKPLVVRENGKISRGRAEAWNVPGSGYDEVAAAALSDTTGGYNPTVSATADDFWLKAKDAYRQYRQLQNGTPIPVRQFVGSYDSGLGIASNQQLLAQIGQLAAHAPFRTGAGVGALLGGAGAQDSNGDGNIGIDERLTSAAEGAAAGLVGAGATKVPAGTLKDLASIGNRAGVENFKEALNTGKGSAKAIAGDWKADKVVTGRNALLDELSNRVRAAIAKVPTATINGTMRSIVDRSQAAGKVVAYDQETEDLLRAVGVDPDAIDFTSALGQGFLTDATKGGGGQLNPLQSAAAGAAYGLLDASNLAIPGVGVAIGAVRGAARPYTSALFHDVNDIQHLGVRGAAYKTEARRALQAAAEQVLPQLQRAGVNVNALDSRGLFDPATVKRLVDAAQGATPGAVGPTAGDALAGLWQGVRDQVVGGTGAGGQWVDGIAGQFVKDTFGDYSSRNALQAAVDTIAPFSRYALGQLPVMGKLVQENPAAALALATWLRHDARQASQEGRPSSQIGTLPISTETPLLGGVVRAELGGAAGQGRLNPLQSLLPVPAKGLGIEEDLGKAENWYQQLQAVMGAAGLQFNPLIKTGAYLVGADPFSPGSQSRFAGIEQAAPGGQVPTIKGVLDETRKAIAPLDKYGYAGDPVETRLKELVLRETKKPLSNPANHRLAVELAQNPDHPLRLQAAEEVTSGNAARSIVSGVSPASISATTAVKQESNQAKAQATPKYSDEQIAQAATVSTAIARKMIAENNATPRIWTREEIARAAAVSPTIAKKMEAANVQTKRENPALAIYDAPS